MKTFLLSLLCALAPAICTFIPVLLVWLTAKTDYALGLLFFSAFAAPLAAIITYIVTVISFCVVGVSKLSFVRVSIIASIGSWILYALLVLIFASSASGSKWS